MMKDTVTFKREKWKSIIEKLEELEGRLGKLSGKISPDSPSKIEGPSQGGQIRKSSRELLLEELGGVCKNCGATEKLDKHHIVPLSRGGSDKLANLILLCRSCHAKVPK